MDQLLIGVWNLIETGMRPSDAVVVGLDSDETAGLVHLLGVSSVTSLDQMSEDALRRLFGPYAA